MFRRQLSRFQSMASFDQPVDPSQLHFKQYYCGNHNAVGTLSPALFMASMSKEEAGGREMNAISIGLLIEPVKMDTQLSSARFKPENTRLFKKI